VWLSAYEIPHEPLCWNALSPTANRSSQISLTTGEADTSKQKRALLRFGRRTHSCTRDAMPDSPGRFREACRPLPSSQRPVNPSVRWCNGHSEPETAFCQNWGTVGPLPRASFALGDIANGRRTRVPSTVSMVPQNLIRRELATVFAHTQVPGPHP